MIRHAVFWFDTDGMTLSLMNIILQRQRKATSNYFQLLSALWKVSKLQCCKRRIELKSYEVTD